MLGGERERERDGCNATGCFLFKLMMEANSRAEGNQHQGRSAARTMQCTRSHAFIHTALSAKMIIIASTFVCKSSISRKPPQSSLDTPSLAFLPSRQKRVAGLSIRIENLLRDFLSGYWQPLRTQETELEPFL